MDDKCIELMDPNGRLVRVLKSEADHYLEQEGWIEAKDEPVKESVEEIIEESVEEPIEDSVDLSGSVEVKGSVGVGEPTEDDPED